jgi:quercetin dioxygenase-like cupin family protein
MERDGKELGQIATDVLFENDRVKIWNLIVEPGEASDWHLHGRDYVTVVVESNGGLDAQFEDGTERLSENVVGDFTYHDSHQVHRVVNNTDKRYRNVLIELK